MKFLDLYKKWSKSDVLPLPGMCNCMPNKKMEEILEQFAPSDKEDPILRKEGMSTIFWGSGLLLDDEDDKKQYSFTPMRQTIILLCAAINGEFD